MQAPRLPSAARPAPGTHPLPGAAPRGGVTGPKVPHPGPGAAPPQSRCGRRSLPPPPPSRRRGDAGWIQVPRRASPGPTDRTARAAAPAGRAGRDPQLRKRAGGAGTRGASAPARVRPGDSGRPDAASWVTQAAACRASADLVTAQPGGELTPGPRSLRSAASPPRATRHVSLPRSPRAGTGPAVTRLPSSASAAWWQRAAGIRGMLHNPATGGRGRESGSRQRGARALPSPPPSASAATFPSGVRSSGPVPR